MNEVEGTPPHRDPGPERGGSALAAALAELLDGAVARVGDYARLDTARARRTGLPEVVLAQGKTPEQTLRLLAELRTRSPNAPALATRCPREVLAAAPTAFPGETVAVDASAGTVTVGDLPPAVGDVAVLTAGTGDLPVARECLAALTAWGVGGRLLADVGVAGLARLLEHVVELRDADCVVVVAGMDGALPSVVTGLVPAPVVGVPTSVGYGFADGGRAAAGAMLSSCAPGLTVVNIDNGFGAAAHAAKIVRRLHGA